MSGGRPTECTAEVIEDFANYMRSGATLEDACALVGVVGQTARNWKREGEAALRKADNDLDAVEDDNRRIWAEFFCTVTRAEAQALMRNLALVQTAAQERPEAVYRQDDSGQVVRDPVTGEPMKMQPGDWRAAAKFVEMRFPDTWGQRKQKLEHTGADGGPVQVHWIDRLREACGEEDDGAK